MLKRKRSSTTRISKYLNDIKTFDLEDLDLERQILHGGYDIIVHCATEYGRRNTAVSDVISANLLLPLRILELSMRAGTRVFVNTDTILDRRISHYSLSKKQFREWLLAIRSDQIRVNVMIEHFYGPGDDSTKFLSAIVDDLLNVVDRIPLTAGSQKRDFVHVNDVVDAFAIIMREALVRPTIGCVDYQIGAGSAVSIREVVELLKALSGNLRTELGFGDLPMREGEIMSIEADLKALHALGWRPKFTLSEGLRTMIEREKELRRCAL